MRAPPAYVTVTVDFIQGWIMHWNRCTPLARPVFE
jgi:hypothetical protein